MRVFLNVLGLIIYAISLYIMFGHDATDYDSPFRIVGGDKNNYTYAYLGAIVVAIIGTGLIVMATNYESTDDPSKSDLNYKLSEPENPVQE